MLERTFGLIKTGAVDRNAIGEIQLLIAEVGLREVRSCPFGTAITPSDLRHFLNLYAAHEGRDYYADLIASVSSVSIAMILEGADAVARWRTLMGPPNPVEARLRAPGSLRARFGGAALPDNAVHGSDSAAAAEAEIAIFFPHQAGIPSALPPTSLNIPPPGPKARAAGGAP